MEILILITFYLKLNGVILHNGTYTLYTVEISEIRHSLDFSLSFEKVMPNMDKIFCSKWLSHRQVVFGTKCNKLMVFDVNTRQVDHIPSLASSENSSPPEGPECGIHAIEINPSKTLLATGGK